MLCVDAKAILYLVELHWHVNQIPELMQLLLHYSSSCL